MRGWDRANPNPVASSQVNPFMHFVSTGHAPRMPNNVDTAMGLAVAELAPKASATIVAEFAKRARMALRLDSYALSMALMFSQVRTSGARCFACAQLRLCHPPG